MSVNDGSPIRPLDHGPTDPALLPIRVLIVEDDEIAAQAHALYVERVEGFRLDGLALTAQQALQILQRKQIDLVLLDINLPDYVGLSLVRAMRAAGHEADVIAVTAVRDLHVVRSAMSLGVVQYILKPFVFATLCERLQTYRSYRQQLADTPLDTQSQVDSVFAQARAVLSASAAPKGMVDSLLSQICESLRQTPDGLSARELADAVQVSRVTARRYGERLVEMGQARRSARYSGSGRPEVIYHWVF